MGKVKLDVGVIFVLLKELVLGSVGEAKIKHLGKN